MDARHALVGSAYGASGLALVGRVGRFFSLSDKAAAMGLAVCRIAAGTVACMGPVAGLHAAQKAAALSIFTTGAHRALVFRRLVASLQGIGAGLAAVHGNALAIMVSGILGVGAAGLRTFAVCRLGWVGAAQAGH